MIPLLLAAPVINGVLGQIMGAITAPSANNNVPPFEPYLNQVQSSSKASIPTSTSVPASGILHATEWNQMSPQDAQAWTQGLAGRHVDATDVSGRTISGVVSHVQQVGGQLAMEIGGHLVSLSQLNQITWAPSVA